MHSYNLNIAWMDGVVLVVDVDVVAVVGRYQFELRVQCIASMLFSASTECERGLENWMELINKRQTSPQKHIYVHIYIFTILRTYVCQYVCKKYIYIKYGGVSRRNMVWIVCHILEANESRPFRKRPTSFISKHTFIKSFHAPLYVWVSLHCDTFFKKTCYGT